MKLISVPLLACVCAAFQAPTSAFAADQLAFYIGGAMGQSSIRNDHVVFTSPFVVPQSYDLDEHHTAWKIMLGLRPIPVLGAELEYLDFGHPRVNTGLQGLPLQADAQVKGPAVFAVGYLPLPIPLLDIYGKVGLAHLQTTVNATNVGRFSCYAACTALAWIPGVYHSNRADSSVAYGAGAQVELSSMAVRFEYERVSETGGDPDLLSLGITWGF